MVWIVFSVLAALILSAGVAVVPAQAASCSGAGCSGKNPSSAGCGDDATTTAYASTPGGYSSAQLRHSSTCKAYWTRLGGNVDCCYRGVTIDVERRYDANGAMSYYSKHIPYGSTGYTLMFGSSTGFSIRACITMDQGGGTGCTGWYK
jgi:hypothetical protein